MWPVHCGGPAGWSLATVHCVIGRLADWSVATVHFLVGYVVRVNWATELKCGHGLLCNGLVNCSVATDHRLQCNNDIE